MSAIYDKYRKVKALAQRGATDGERAAAQAALERMEQAHPELKTTGHSPDLPWPGYKPYIDFARYWD